MGKKVVIYGKVRLVSKRKRMFGFISLNQVTFQQEVKYMDGTKEWVNCEIVE